MAPSRGFEAELAAVHAAGALAPQEALPELRKALGSRSNLVVSTAAKYAARLELNALTENLAAAFGRFMPGSGNPAKTDPQCWAKNELVKALAAFEYQDPSLFVAGLGHTQLEPVWGGSSDTAGPLRGACALALVQCRDVRGEALLRHLIPLLRDVELPVRVNAVRAIEQVGTDSAALLLRLRCVLGSDEPEVLGACFLAVLRLEGGPALPWVASFLQSSGETASEAAFALAEQRSMAAFACLQKELDNTEQMDFRQTLFSAIASMRLPEAHHCLLAFLVEPGPEARFIARALWDSGPSPETAAELLSLGHLPP